MRKAFNNTLLEFEISDTACRVPESGASSPEIDDYEHIGSAKM